MKMLTTLSLIKLINDLIMNIFNDYKCLNIHIHRLCDCERNEIIRELHQTPFTLIVSDDFTQIDEQCGFTLLTNSYESLKYLENRTYYSIIRILIVTDSDDIFSQLEVTA